MDSERPNCLQILELDKYFVFQLTKSSGFEVVFLERFVEGERERFQIGHLEGRGSFCCFESRLGNARWGEKRGMLPGLGVE